VPPAPSQTTVAETPRPAQEVATIAFPDARRGVGAAPGAPLLPSVPGYDLLEELGQGGMGVVYKALQIELNRPVALKMILAGARATPEELARFKGEAEAVARLQHPNVVQIHEVREQDGLPYFSLEFVEGGNLAQKLQGEPQQPRYAAALVQALAHGIHAAHE